MQAEETELQQRVEEVLQRLALGAARYTAAALVLLLRLLSGRRAITSALVALLLWLGMVVGELRVTSQVRGCAAADAAHLGSRCVGTWQLAPRVVAPEAPLGPLGCAAQMLQLVWEKASRRGGPAPPQVPRRLPC